MESSPDCHRTITHSETRNVTYYTTLQVKLRWIYPYPTLAAVLLWLILRHLEPSRDHVDAVTSFINRTDLSTRQAEILCPPFGIFDDRRLRVIRTVLVAVMGILVLTALLSHEPEYEITKFTWARFGTFSTPSRHRLLRCIYKNTSPRYTCTAAANCGCL